MKLLNRIFALIAASFCTIASVTPSTSSPDGVSTPNTLDVDELADAAKTLCEIANAGHKPLLKPATGTINAALPSLSAQATATTG